MISCSGDLLVLFNRVLVASTKRSSGLRRRFVLAMIVRPCAQTACDINAVY